MKKNVQNAFSLMEMMVVLLIVAIIAAATAPMVTKKMARSVGSGDSPWVFTGLNNNIAYNLGGANASAIIGASNYSYGDNQPKYPRLVLAAGDSDHPTLVFAKSNGAFGGQINMDADNSIVTMNDQSVGNNSVAFGIGQTITGTPSGIVAIGQGVTTSSADTVAIGRSVTASGSYAVAVGRGSSSTLPGAVAVGRRATAEGKNSISIGNCAGVAASGGQTTGTGSVSIGNLTIATTRSVAIGDQAQALGTHSVAIGGYNNRNGRWTEASNEYSVAIGAGAQTTADHQIVLGTNRDTVYIPGNLVVEGYSVLGINGSSRVFLNLSDSNGGNGICQVGSGQTENNVLGVEDKKTNSGFGTSYSNALSWFSDRRLKNVGEKYTAGLDELKKLDFYHYTFKADKDNTPFVGVIAQDLQKVFPDAVTKDESGYLRIRIEDMFYAVINAVKELDTKISEIVTNITDIKATIQSQQDAIDILKKENAELKDEIKDIEKRIKKLEK